MDILFALLGAAVTGAGVWLSMCRWSSDQEKKKRNIPVLLAAVVIGALGGFFIPERVPHWVNWIRLVGALALLSGAAWCDLKERRIPNFFSVALLCVFAVCSVLDLMIFGSEGWTIIIGGVVGGAVMLGLLMLCRFFSRGGIGYGDIKILAALGTVLGLYGAISTMFLAQVVALLVALVLILLRKASFRDSLPFAPFFYIGFVLTLCLGTF